MFVRLTTKTTTSTVTCHAAGFGNRLGIFTELVNTKIPVLTTMMTSYSSVTSKNGVARRKSKNAEHNRENSIWREQVYIAVWPCSIAIDHSTP